MAEYIEREALIAEFSKCTIIPDDLYDYGIMAGIDAGKKKVKDAPAADVAPVVHGRWEYYDFVSTGDGLIPVYACSACQGCFDEEEFHAQNYCPNCGARMDGET